MTYSIAVAERARDMRDAGLDYRAIADRLASEGVDPRPSHTTVRLWCDDKAAREFAEARTPGDRRLRRMRQLRDAGLSANAVSKVMLLDYGERVSPFQVDRWLAAGTWQPKVGRPRKSEAVAA